MCRIYLQKGLTREEVKRSSKRMNLRLRTSHHDGKLPRILKIARARFKEKNKVEIDGSTLSTNSIHSHDEDNVEEREYNIKTC